MNDKGQWVVNGVVQTRVVEKEVIPIDYAAYVPVHSLANVVDAWNLILPYKSVGPLYICGKNVQTLLTTLTILDPKPIK